MPTDSSGTLTPQNAVNPNLQATLWNFMTSGIKAQRAVNDITANHHKGNPQSQAAHKKASKSADKSKRAILAALSRIYQGSCERLEYATGLSHQTCSARISELKRDGKIIKSGTTKTRSGCTAAIYKIT